MSYSKPRQAKMAEYPQLSHEARPKHLGSTRSRLNEFIGGHFSDDNLSTAMFHHQKSGDDYVQLSVWDAPGRSKPTFEEAKRATYKPAKVGDSFGPSWTNHWFKVTIHIPSDWSHYERVQLEFDSTGEAMVYTTDGYPLHGLTGGYGRDRRVEFIIPEKERKAGVAHYFIEATCNKLGGQNDIHAPDDNQYYRLNSADLCVPNMEAWRLMWDFETLKGVLDSLPDDTPLAMRCLYVANEIMNVFVPNDPESIKKARKVAETILGEDWERMLNDESEDAAKQQGTLWGIGHCHIDTAWLWPFSVTQQKSARSWSTQLDLMNRYPEHRFSATQAQQFKWLEQLYPELFDKLKERVAEGKFQPLGATWVEMDVNMPSGESLCRQFLYGQRYFESRFGFRSDTFVLPDTFGYSSQLPQIARSAGAKNFFTQKLSWNHDNVFPHSTFNWVGIDSSQILTHMTPVDTYGAQADIQEIRKGMTNNKNLEVTQQALYLFGNGDGGGGPTPPMMEKLRRARAVGKRNDVGGQLPLVKMGGSFSEFYDSVRKETKNGSMLPNWRGELYGEFHRGTYTTQARGKRENRRSEFLMREAEYAATMASLIDPSYEYPKKRFDAAWEDILLCQFHDVLPGSAIAMVYEDAQNKYAAIRKSISAVIEEAYDVLYKSSRAVIASNPIKEAGKLFALNTIWQYPRQAVVEVPIDTHPGLKTAAAQISKSGQKGMVLLDATDLSQPMIAHPKGLYADVPRVTVAQAGYNTFTMANGNIALTIRDGRIVSVFDKAHERELIPEGQTGGMVIMEDHPNYWDAWDVDQFHLEKQTHLKFGQVHILEDGPLRATLAATVQLGQSRMDIEISMDAIPASVKVDARSLIRFHAVVDWREKHKFLKFELPLDISAENASYETQFGYLSRPTHRNTSWDNAKFEVCAHKYADLSEFGYGVALINDCKYGYATEGNVMRLSLLRSPTEPDPYADQGTQEMSWAIYPHVGTLAESDVPQVAYAFNVPLQLRFAPALSDCMSSPHSAASPFKVLNAPNVQLETIKRAEDDDCRGKKATLIVRLFEQLGGHAKPVLKISGLKVIKAELANILEDSIEEVKVTTDASASASGEGKTESSIKLSFRGFEVKTLKLTVETSDKKQRAQAQGQWRRDSVSSSTAEEVTTPAAVSSIQSDGWIKL